MLQDISVIDIFQVYGEATTPISYSLMASIRNDMFAQPANYSRNFDQYLLASKLWPIIKVGESNLS